MPPRPKKHTTNADPAAAGLTGRQHEILALLQAGKGNKAIATELGIGLGTVKQHVVALFRKLNVTSRAAAISHGYDVDWHPYPSTASLLSAPAEDSLVELRPACVLSIAATGGPDGWRMLNRHVTAVVADHDWTTVALPGSGIDIIFGLHRVGEADSLHALAAARDIAAAMDAAGMAVQAGLAAGFLVASMHVHGGWTGESVAGRTIARARGLRDAAAPGTLLSDVAYRRLAAFAGRVDDPADDDGAVPLTGAPPWRPAAAARPRPMVGRAAEMETLRRAMAAAAGAAIGMRALVEAEAGMGKTTLGAALAQQALPGHVGWATARCGGGGIAATLAAIGRRKGRPLANPGPREALAGVRRGLEKGPLALFIDDVHDAGDGDAAILAEAAALADSAPVLLVAAGRRLRHPALAGLTWQPRLRLGRLSPADMAALIDARGGAAMDPDDRAAIADLAQGVPLFAVELLRSAATLPHRADMARLPPLSLIALVLSRLDGRGLDRTLLRQAARCDAISEGMLRVRTYREPSTFEQELAKVMEAGVLSRDGDGIIRFAHPLVREVLRCVMLADRPGSDAWKAAALAI
ncbi:LuxR C-terminal-related transcriptional regulator [Magnetospirillum sp. UT-4]|uniref:LuxR C-terminal-related transcriptional regulator n=1 Tax=Magnetospirillum sp. UT-4 TaxID=2681467 RepID=UPI001381A836|nr:LuxR C-terminal-related transcriptional regulator [Magnetospirillum sp. UT-4]CAA7612952.1 hypothetical protein MTBUT4_120113 [Magnetospirillum sp. UT-4]